MTPQQLRTLAGLVEHGRVRADMMDPADRVICRQLVRKGLAESVGCGAVEAWKASEKGRREVKAERGD